MKVPGVEQVPPNALLFYRRVLQVLSDEGLEFLVGGAWAIHHYAGIYRSTKDFDIFIAREDYLHISQVLAEAGYKTELTYPHWLGKVQCSNDTIDLVFSSGNRIADVDELWFRHAEEAELFGFRVKICPVEETIWSKAYIMERERFDGADVAHLILACSQTMDWQRLLMRFGDHWRLLLSHLILFEFIYPDDAWIIPRWLRDELLERLQRSEQREPLAKEPLQAKTCAGTLLSREQYLNDISFWGYQDARLRPRGKMTRRDIALWTEAIKDKYHH